MINKRIKLLYEKYPLGVKVFVKYITSLNLNWAQFINVQDELLVLYAHGFILHNNCSIIFDKDVYFVKANMEGTILAKNVGECFSFISNQSDEIEINGIYKSGLMTNNEDVILKVFEDLIEMINFDINAQKLNISKDNETDVNYSEDDLPF